MQRLASRSNLLRKLLPFICVICARSNLFGKLLPSICVICEMMDAGVYSCRSHRVHFSHVVQLAITHAVLPALVNSAVSINGWLAPSMHLASCAADLLIEDSVARSRVSLNYFDPLWPWCFLPRCCFPRALVGSLVARCVPMHVRPSACAWPKLFC